MISPAMVRGILSAIAAIAGGIALMPSLPTTPTTIATAVMGLLLGWAHFARPGDVKAGQ